jgi:formamidopyrimidine-DNA glycosylase
MPELPEVEFARKQLDRWLRGTTLRAVSIADARILDKRVAPSRVTKALTGRLIVSVDRRGKWLRIVLDKGRVFSHLGMTGKWVLADPARARADEPVRFEKVRFEAQKGGSRRVVCYTDPRLFGRFVIANEDIEGWTELGPDPLHDGIESGKLLAKLARRTIPIKPVLLDQAVLAGVGNIQATEALFFARIDPRRKASTITLREAKALVKGIERTIEKTLAAQGEGDTIAYVEERGAPNPFTIYGRGGKPCPRCKSPLAKIMLAGRGTVFCRSCQG